jgi:nucleotide-binding universal stress UspA family protein
VHDQQAIAHIAAAIDPYPEGRDAAALAAALAQATEADLMLFAVEPDLPLLVPGMNWKSIRKETDALLARARESFAPHARVAIETDLSIPRGLERAVRSENRDLLVVGSSQHGPQGKVSIGRLTRQLLDDFQCALAVAPRGLSERPPVRFDRIGVGYDGEPESAAALALALATAVRCGAELTICGVVDDHIPALGWPHVWLGDIMTAKRWAYENPCKLVEKPDPEDTDKDIRFLDQAELDALVDAAGVRYRHGPKMLERAARVRTLRDVEKLPWKKIAAAIGTAESTAIYLYRCEPDAMSVSDADLRRVERVLYLTAAMTGLRQGELIALRWTDVDWLARKVRVRRNYLRGKFGTPKSKRSSRAVPLADRGRARARAAAAGGASGRGSKRPGLV